MRRLEQGLHPDTGEDEAMEARDMLWTDVDAVALLRACAAIDGNDSDVDTDGARDEQARSFYADQEYAVGEWRSTWGIVHESADDELALHFANEEDAADGWRSIWGLGTDSIVECPEWY